MAEFDLETNYSSETGNYSEPEGARVKVPPLFFVIICGVFLCSKFPARLQKLNSTTKSEQIHEVEISSF